MHPSSAHAPLGRGRQDGGRGAGDLEEDAHGVHVVVWRAHLRQLDQRDAKRPHVRLPEHVDACWTRRPENGHRTQRRQMKRDSEGEDNLVMNDMYIKPIHGYQRGEYG